MQRKRAYTIKTWDIALPDTGPGQGAVVETFIHEEDGLPGNLYIVGQVYSSRERRTNAELLSKIVETLESSLKKGVGSPIETVFEQALARTNRLIKDERKSSFRNYTLKIHLVVVLHTNNTLYVSRIGHGVMLQERDGILSHITRRPLYSSDPNHHLVFQEIIEVSLKKNDVLFLGTPQIYKVGEKVLTGRPTSKTLESELSVHRDDLRSLGLIMLSLSTPTETAEFVEKERKPLAQTIFTSVRKHIALKKPLFIILLILIIGGLLMWALQAQRTAVIEQKQEDILVQKIVILEEKTAALIELENYEEATLLVKQIQNNITELKARYSITSTSEKLINQARYLSSLLPIVEE